MSSKTRKYKAKNNRRKINRKIKSGRNSVNGNEMLVIDILKSLIIEEGFVSIKKLGS
jgi:hypothetical protein